ncbi:MAG: branched-chain amino acid ABC transporter permease [Phycisphaerales bacterium]|nr:branched-chain amino acid ABC transporter permease [Phycisphaerales bacterium]
MRSLVDSSIELRPRLGPTILASLWPIVVGIAFAVAMQLFVKPNINDYFAKQLLDIGISIVLAVSLTMVNGFTGQFSMGHAGFMAAGGYAAGAVCYYVSLRIWGTGGARGSILSGMPLDPSGLPSFAVGDLLFLGSLLVGGLVSALLGFLVGLPSLRLRGDYLAIVTLGFGEIVRVLIQQTEPVIKTAAEAAQTPVLELPIHVGGALGFTGLPKYTSLFWAYLVAAITIIVAFRLKRSTFGRAFLSIREDEIASEVMGVNTTRFKVWAFVIAAFFAGVAGGLFAHTLGVGLSAEAAGFMKSFDVIIMVVLGGLGSISGATAAAIVFTLLPEVLRDPLATPAWIVVAILGVWASLSGLAAWRSREGGAERPWVMKLALKLLIPGACVVAIYLAGKNGIDLSPYRMIFFALLLILMMIFRPEGLLGVREIWEREAWSWLIGGRRKAVAASPPQGGGS